MPRRYHVGLAVTSHPAGPFTVVRPDARYSTVNVHSGFVFPEAGLADAFVSAALCRSDVLDALQHVCGCGFSGFMRSMYTAVGAELPDRDLWGMVVYDHRTTGVRLPPALVYGLGRQLRNVLTWPMRFGPDPVPVDFSAERKDGAGHGYIPFDKAKTDSVGLFTMLAVSMDLRF